MNSINRNDIKKLLIDKKREIVFNIRATDTEINDLNSNNDILDDMDYASLRIDNLIDESISSKQKSELKEIDYALEKIDSDDFGICEMCNCEISIDRLKSKPFAKYCIECRTVFEKRNHALKDNKIKY